MAGSASRPALRSDTDSSTDTGRMLRSPSVRPLLNPQQVRVERLAALVHLDCDVGVFLGEPFLYPPRIGDACPLALNERDELVRRIEQGTEQQTRAHEDVVGDCHDAITRDPDVVALVHLA